MKTYGITGLAGSGKDEATKIFEKHGYQHLSTGGALRERAKELGIDINNRTDLINLANELRKTHHAGILAELASKQATSDKVIFSGIRNSGEVDFLKLKYEGFKMINISAPDEIRFERLKKRGRENASQTLNEFKAMTKEDYKTGIGDVIDSTKMIIINDGTVAKLTKMIELFIQSENRPDWDEYFLKIAEAVGLRADCCRGRLGTILVRDERIISTGYNAAPRGLPHCSEVGCMVTDHKDAEGNVRDACIRTAHSDINAIIQAALHGISTAGTTLYGYYKPCFNCAKAIVQAGIVRVVVRKNYHESRTDEIFKQAGIKMEILNPHEDGQAPGK
jgi:dCMP deaminase